MRSERSELVRRYQGRITNLISRVLNDRECSDDLAQEVFVRVYIHRRNYRRGSKLSTWVFTIAANLAKNEIRRRVRRRNWFSLDALQEAIKDGALMFADPKEGHDRAMERGSSRRRCGDDRDGAREVPPGAGAEDVEAAVEEIAQVLDSVTVRSRINRRARPEAETEAVHDEGDRMRCRQAKRLFGSYWDDEITQAEREG
jgi:RNA polymerase sigma-70 factor (ECF subfamily)